MKVKQYKVNTSLPKKSSPDGNLSYGDLIVEIGRLFINAPYKEETLEDRRQRKVDCQCIGL